MNFTGRSRNTSFQRLTKEQCEDIHYASLEILEKTGVYLEDDAAVSILLNSGAERVEANKVSIPAHLVERAISSAPKQINIYDREGNMAMRLGGSRCYFGPGSDGNNIIDHRTDKRRNGILRDVEEGARICDYLDNIDFVMSLVIPKDKPQEIMDIFQMQAMLSNTTKPIIIVNSTSSGMNKCIEMAEIVAGGEKELRRKPFIVSFINMARALLHNKDALQRLMLSAEKGLPFTYVSPKSLKGTITPVTTAGLLALNNAGQLAGLVLSQLISEGTPFIAEGAGGGNFDMKTTLAALATPDNREFSADLANYYQLPMFGTGGVSDSKTLDEQCASEMALTLLLQALSGVNLVHDVGYLESSSTQSFKALVICDEIISWIKHCLQDLEVSNETLALEVINEVEPTGDYLSHEHTLKHFRSSWYPQLFDRNRYGEWVSKGKKSLGQRAFEYVENILEKHNPKPLHDTINKQIEDFVLKLESNRLKSG